MDEAGLLSVYLGRSPCAPPDKSIAVFRPSRGGEQNVDVAVVTQKLIPIIAGRVKDKIIVFDSFGTSSRLIRRPKELIFLCIDSSGSMVGSSELVHHEDCELARWDRHFGGSASYADETVQKSTIRSLGSQSTALPIC